MKRGLPRALMTDNCAAMRANRALGRNCRRAFVAKARAGEVGEATVVIVSQGPAGNTKTQQATPYV